MEHTLRGHINALHALSDDEETRRLLLKDLSDETLRGVIGDGVIRNNSRGVLEGLATFLLEEVARQTRTQLGASVRAVEHGGARIKEEDEDSLLGEAVDRTGGDEAVEEKADISPVRAPIETRDSLETRYGLMAEDSSYSTLNERNILPTKLRSRASSPVSLRTKKRARKPKNTVTPLDEAKKTHEDTDSEIPRARIMLDIRPSAQRIGLPLARNHKALRGSR